MENDLSEKTPQTKLVKETELSENTDYRGIAGEGSLNSGKKADKESPASAPKYDEEETDHNPLIRGI